MTWSTKTENALIFYQIISTNFSKKCMEISLENLYVELGDYRIRSSKDRVAMIQSLVFEKINWKKSKAKKNAVHMEKSALQLGMKRSKN